MEKINFYKQFINYGMDSYIQTFKDFKANNKNYDEDLKKLLKNLDEQSIENINSFLELMYKLPLPSKDFLVRKNSIYSSKELKQINNEEKIREQLESLSKPYKLQGFEKIEINVFKHHCGLKFLPNKILKKLANTLFVDAGAFWGDSMLILQKYKPAKTICFEPNSVNYNLLTQTISRNTPNKVATEQLGLSNQKEQKILNYISNHQNHGASFIFSPKKVKKENAENISLDEYLENKPEAQPLGLLKIDVEGMGLKAILGAKNNIIKHKPVISCAVYHNPEELFYVKTCLERLNLGYSFSFIPLLQSFILKELTLLAWVD
jgi:FkbM family methyltransferase